jgi:hypothetical protein
MIFNPDRDGQDSQRLTKLRARGGIMFFVIERPCRLYKGTIMLSPVENCYQRRAVYIREYKYKEARDETKSAQDK